MGRSPCCEKKGLKRGPWTAEEDMTLVAHIEQHGHGNWRALPKLAGLLRCGKSCRLRWINYLRPDIKRGDFSVEEEDAIVHLHAMLGNRWSAIAARLPGRTDNEIKNVWHTHLKKRNPSSSAGEAQGTAKRRSAAKKSVVQVDVQVPVSPEQSLSTSESFSSEEFQIDDSFWSETLGMTADCSSSWPMETGEPLDADSSSNDGMDFWVRLFMQAGDMQNLAQI